jgi:hypothetical protein
VNIGGVGPHICVAENWSNVKVWFLFGSAAKLVVV